MTEEPFVTYRNVTAFDTDRVKVLSVHELVTPGSPERVIRRRMMEALGRELAFKLMEHEKVLFTRTPGPREMINLSVRVEVIVPGGGSPIQLTVPVRFDQANFERKPDDRD